MLEGSTKVDLLLASILLSLIIGITSLVGFLNSTEISPLLSLVYAYLLAALSFATICLGVLLGASLEDR